MNDIDLEQVLPEPAQDSRAPHSAGADSTIESGSERGEITAKLAAEYSSRDGRGPRSVEGMASRSFGDYEILEELGRGGMGVVYRARQVSLNRIIALKLIKAGVLADDVELRRFQNEAEALALLDHPGIVPIHDVGEHGGQKYFTMKLVAGGSLAERLGAYKTDPRAAVTLVVDLAEAVHHAHMRGILHRDLKPANVLIDETGRAHVTDFGLARKLDGDAELTASGAILGTPAYAAPEQTTGRRAAVTTATDVYGLGAILYSLLAGRAPFVGDSVVDVLKRVREHAPGAPRSFNSAVPRDVEVVCLKCLEKDARHRYGSAQALAEDLRAWLDNRPIAARPVGALVRSWLWCKRRPALAGMLAALALLLLGTTIFLIAYARLQADQARIERTLLKAAVTQNERNARLAYDSAMRLAWSDWQDGNSGGALELLAATRPLRDRPDRLRGFEWFYLDRLCNTALWTYAPAELKGQSIAFGPDGTWIALARLGRDVKRCDITVLDASTGRELRTIPANRSSSSGVAVSPDGATIALGSAGGAVLLLDAKTGRVTHELIGHRIEITQLSFGGGGRLLASLGTISSRGEVKSELKIWDVAKHKEARSVASRDYTYGIAFSRDARRIATASGAALQVWDVASGRVVWKVPATGSFTSVAFAPDGRLLAASSVRGWIGLWDASTATRGGVLSGHRGEIQTIRFSPDGRRLASGGQDGIVRIWDISSERVELELRGHQRDVWDLAFAPDGRRLVSVSLRDGAVKLWDADRRQESVDLVIGGKSSDPTLDPSSSYGLAFQPEGRTLIMARSGAKKGAVEMWDVERQARVLSLEYPAAKDRSLIGVSTMTGVLATVDEQGSIVLRNLATGAMIHTLNSSKGTRVVAFSPDGSLLAGGVENSPEIRVWEIGTGRVVELLRGHTAAIQCLGFSGDGRTLASGSGDDTVRIWELSSHRVRPVFVYRGHSAPIACVAFSRDGKLVASAAFEEKKRSGAIHLWNATTGELRQVFHGHSSFARRMALLPDGRRLASLGDEGQLKIWDFESGQELLSLAAHEGGGAGLAVSPDGRRIATSGWEGDVRIWDAGAGATTH
jgi:WD40 repeat protein